MEDQKTLQTSTLISQFNSVQHQIDDLLPNRVMATRVIVRCVLLPSNQLLGMKELPVCTGTDFINHSWLQVNKNRSWDVLPGTSFAKESVEGIIATANRFVAWHLSIGLNTMFKTVQFPASVSDLHTGLSNMDRDTLTHIKLLVVGIGLVMNNSGLEDDK